ncbi:hypothetical protein SLEP1_g8041 [Rubroshorea leprosula]|uniref:DNA-directed RNA polymerase III subunit RPC5 n=1 Tax=Rubroshorea leprosula TaxID=152421 RepID=A0AAV5IBC7_9ROSI|nr:hypothetical protein SLEP1_g8041 [Rubroshorea leprosula]
MNIEELEDLDGPSQVNARTSKFAPKSSKFAPKIKPKVQLKLESKLEPQEPTGKQKTEPGQSNVLVSKKKENQEVDAKSAVFAELKSEALVSNGAVKMDIDTKAEAEEESKLYDAMEEDREEEEQEQDMIVREIDVFFTPSIDANTQLYVLQYPLRPSWRPYELDERCEEVRVEPASGSVEVDLPLDVDSRNYNGDVTNNKMTKQTLRSVWMPPRATGYAVGVLMGDKLHLNPIHAVVQLRPSLEHLKSGGSKKKHVGTADIEGPVKTEESTEGKSVGPSSKQNKRAQSSTEQKADDEKCFVPLKYHGSVSDFSAQYLQKMMAQESSPIQFTMNSYDYVDSLCPGASNNIKATGASRRFLLSMPLDERFKKLLSEGPPIQRFSALKHFAPDASTEDVFGVLEKHADLLQGLWVPKSKLLFPGDSSKSLPRDYVLVLFSKKTEISLEQVNFAGSRKDEVKGFLKSLAIERPSFKDWKLKEQPDVAFMKRYPDIVKKQEEAWKVKDGALMSLMLKIKGGSSKTKPNIAIKPEKAVNLDKGEAKAVPGAQALRKMADETREAMPRYLKKVFQIHKVCSLQLIRKGLRDLAVSQSATPKLDHSSKFAVTAAAGADAPENELKEVISQVAVEIGGLYVLKSSLEHPEYDPFRNVVIDLLLVNGKFKKAEVKQAASIALKREITDNEYNKVVTDFCEYKSGWWVLKSGDGKPN